MILWWLSSRLSSISRIANKIAWRKKTVYVLDEATKLFEEKKEQRIFTGIRPLYTSTKDNPYGIRIKIRMSDAIDLDVLRKAVDTTMQRYPCLFWVRGIQKNSG
jgi:hypothetical protein